jgi:hypothetical protein
MTSKLALILTSFCFALLAPGLPAQDLTIRFKDVTQSAGLEESLQGMMGHGAAVGDFDADGRVDLFVGGFCDRPSDEYKPHDGPVPNRLFRNLDGGKFELVDDKVIAGFGRMSGAVFADFDNNGSLELYVANNAKPQTRRTDEPQRSAQLQRAQLLQYIDGKFVDVTRAANACPEDLLTARNIGVLDFDNDGLLDLLVIEDRFRKGSHSRLLRNQGGLKFVDATADAGLPPDLFGLGLAIADLNDDLYPDFFVGHSNRMFISNGDGTYREPEALRKLFAWSPLHNEDWPCGAAFGDLNGDGRLDMVLSVHGEQARNKVFFNEGIQNGTPQFRDVTAQVGLGETVPSKCPHVEIQDFDNDGRPDLYFSAAWLDGDTVVPLVMRNTPGEGGLPRFLPPRKTDAPMVYFPAGPSLDFDDDGRLDLFLVNWFPDNRCRMMQNVTSERHWLKVRVLGTDKVNRMGIGTKIFVYKSGALGQPASLLGFQEIATGYGYASGQVAECHFGLGDHTKVDLKLILPNGQSIVQSDVPSQQRLVISEPEEN